MPIQKTVMVCEGGLFQSVAHRLARDFERVLYFRDWRSSFSHPNDLYIGTGYDRIERIESIWDHVEETDIFCFPDIGFAAEQSYLRSIEKPVWGAGNGEELELLRAETKELLMEIGLPVQPWSLVTGMKALREYLKKHDDVHVKVSKVRGLTESFHSKNYDLVCPKLDEMEHELGGRKEVQEFCVEAGIPDALEIGYDGYFVGGFPKSAVFGCEIKDVGYACQVKPYASIPKECQTVNGKLAPIMESYGYRGFFSTEIRVGKDKKPYLIDVTARSASPAGECYQELWSNFSEIIEGGASGQLIEPKPTGKFAAQAIITSSSAEQNWLPVNIPEKIRPWFKLYHSCIVEGQEFIVPTEADMAEIGSVVAVGNTLDEAIKKCREYAGQIEGFGIKVKTDAMDEAKAELAKA